MHNNPGQQIGNYHLLRLLGRGGFADVYQGEHIYLKTQAAIKVLQMQLGGDERDNFLNEARTIAHLIHPNIIRVLDFGIQGYTPFLVMDFAPNGTLRQRHPNGSRLPLATIISYVKQVASALQYAHDQNFIHRDVKPGNMLLGRQNEILLSDFGIALVAQSTHSQSTQDTVGTVAYMAPEQIEGKPRPASDQYALGIVVYEWLCGERPFQGSLTEIITQQLSSAPPSIHARYPEISLDVEEAVMTALAKDPHERFATVQAFAHALEQSSQSTHSTSGLSFTGITPNYPHSIPSTQPVMILPPIPNSAQSRMAPLQQEIRTEPDPERESDTPIRKEIESHNAKPNPVHNPNKYSTRQRSVSQIIAMMIGLLFYGGVYYFISLLSFEQKDLASYVLFSLSIVIPLFFGVEFGPLVGFVTGMGGYLLGHYLSHNPGYWNNGFGIGLTGMLAGFAMLRTKWRYNRFRSFLIAGLFISLGVIIGEAFADFSSVWVFHADMVSATINFLIFALLELLFALILLPVLLPIYSALTRRRERKY